MSACDRASDTQKARFTGGMGGIRKHPDLAPKQPLDIVDRYAVPGALGAITLVPVESGNAFDHPWSIAACMYIWLHDSPLRTSPLELEATNSSSELLEKRTNGSRGQTLNPSATQKRGTSLQHRKVSRITVPPADQ